MDQKQIIVNVSPAGHTTIEAVGYEGCGCAEAVEVFEVLIGGGEAKRERKAEFHMPAGVNSTVQQTF